MYTVLFLCSVLVAIVYYYLKSNNEYWKRKNIPYPEPIVFFGNLLDTMLFKKSLGQKHTEFYESFPDYPYIGIYKMRQPSVLIRDPELVHSITVKDFHNFENNDFEIDVNVDPIAGRNQFFLKGEKWNTARKQLSVCFTSGKLKLMFPLLTKSAKDMVKYLEENIKQGQTTFEAKELSTKFTTDNVASCAFGLEGMSFVDENAEFRKFGKILLNPSLSTGIRILIGTMFPSLSKILKVKFVTDEPAAYFRGIITSTLQYRKQNNIVRNDFLDIVNQIRDKDDSFTLDDVIAHAFSFFTDGYETSSIALSYTLYELAKNLDVQEKLRSEIRNVLGKNNGEITYEGVQEVNYLDWVIHEAIRKHPPAMSNFKLCTKEYEFPAINGNGKGLKVKVGTPIVIPIYGIHNDAKIYPNSEKFDPERFSDERKSTIPKGAFYGFGMGPRICIGQRFALLQLKVGIVFLMNNFDVRLNKTTKEPLEIDPKYFLLSAIGGLWLDFYKRND